jgi:mannose-6-phosphate isomerase-like protein (cupin superfamily)
VGDDHGGLGISLLVVDAQPGDGPSLHQHPYAEVFIVQEGEAAFVAGDEERTVTAGEVVIVPPRTPHSFRVIGDGPLRQIDIHINSRFETEWMST